MSPTDPFPEMHFQTAYLPPLLEQNASTIHLERRQQVHGLDDALILVQSGLIAVYRADVRRRRQIAALRYAGDVILPAEFGHSFCTETLIATELATIPAPNLSSNRGSKLSSFLWLIATRNERIAFEWLCRLSLLGPSNRVAHLICETVVRSGAQPHERILLTQEQLAQVLGSTSVHMNRVLRELRDAGLVSTSKGIRVLDWPALVKTCGFDASYLVCQDSMPRLGARV